MEYLWKLFIYFSFFLKKTFIEISLRITVPMLSHLSMLIHMSYMRVLYDLDQKIKSELRRSFYATNHEILVGVVHLRFFFFPERKPNSLFFFCVFRTGSNFFSFSIYWALKAWMMTNDAIFDNVYQEAKSIFYISKLFAF